ncbi:Putative transposase (IS66 family element) [gamma proteobacterium HdN1]|nr:Transposase IS66 [gamma proteobacterium HdN1]CBL45525.1 Transposase [gamma proteobacterium HdN1]CBL45598.1 Transposase, IS66 family [gamma proteobacterium HdN1]CBL46557.1 Transposase, IS66 family [gamma proteobacterium HdN1]CBL46564.1 Transposase, IS66 family [gamma proteobacterium HdN1]
MKTTENTTLPDDVERLKALVLALQNKNSALQKEAAKEAAEAKRFEKLYYETWEKWQLALRSRFASKSEAYDGQVDLFNEIEQTLEPTVEEIAEADAEKETITYTRKKARAPRIAPELPREDVLHDLADKDKVCGCCGHDLHRMGEEVSEKLEFIPAHVKVLRHIRPKYSCRQCEQQAIRTEIKIAPVPASVLPKSIASASLLTQIICAKFVYGLPLYRQEALFKSFGIEINRQTMSRWLIKVSEQLRPLYKYFHRRLLEQPAIWSDDTRIKVIETDNAQCAMWVYGCGMETPLPGGAPPIVLYDYRDGRAGRYITDFLQGYSGLLQVDGYQAYQQTHATLIGCWAHARRKFKEAKDVQPKGKTGRADVALSLIQKLYAIEKSLPEKTIEERLAIRQQQSAPILQQIKEYLEKTAFEVPPKTAIGLAVHYSLNQWNKLTAYLGYGETSIDNNRAERAIKPFVIGRKNWLFANTRTGATASAILYSIVETAKANGLRPEQYLQALLEQLPTTQAEEIELLTPWNITLS